MDWSLSVEGLKDWLLRLLVGSWACPIGYVRPLVIGWKRVEGIIGRWTESLRGIV